MQQSLFHTHSFYTLEVMLSQRGVVFCGTPGRLGFLWVLQFPPTGNVDKVGWDL